MSNRPLRLSLMAVSFVQGVLLYFVYKSATGNVWPYIQPQAFLPILSVLLVIPTATILLYQAKNIKKVLLGLLGFAVVVMLIGFYSGYQLLPFNELESNSGKVYLPFFLLLFVSTFLFCVYLNVWVSDKKIEFSQLSIVSWRYCVIIILAVVFTGIAYGLLVLCASLFDMVGLSIFKDIFYESWFIFPFLFSALGFFIVLLKDQNKITDSIAYILVLLSTYLLVLVSVISIMFLVVLPFTGFDKLWESNFGASLMITLQCFVLLLFNMVYSAKEQKLNRVFEWIIKIALSVLVFYSLLSIYAVVIRIDQYGLTVSRLYAITLCLLLLALNLAYMVSMIVKYKTWLVNLHKVNVGFAMVLFVLSILISSPFLDFRKISVNSQLARLDQSTIDVLDIDGSYFKRHFARPGYLALQTLEQNYKDKHPDLISIITKRKWKSNRENERKAEVKMIKQNMLVYSDFEIAVNEYEALIDKIQGQFYFNNNTSKKYHLLIKDLNNDAVVEYIMLILSQDNKEVEKYSLKIEVFEKTGSLFKSIKTHWVTESAQALMIIESLAKKEYELVPSKWSDLKIGDQIIPINAH
ncbi:MAG: DUF4153 domain-containing protein [Saccharospirillaceae bacterium]|nr:DUF4153 domain-containing protein [Saccharospirillaceae bacterium]